MSRMGNEVIRRADAASLDNADEAAELRRRIGPAREALGPIGMIALIDVASYLRANGRDAMARAVDDASDAICRARAALEGSHDGP